MIEPYIKIRNASFALGEFPVLYDIDLHLSASKSIAIIGPSASGKTSLLKAVAGKIFPRQGKVERIGKVEFVPSDYKFHRFVGAVYQYYQQRYHAYDSELGPTLYEVLQNQVKPMGTIDDRSVDLPEPLYSEEKLNDVADKFKISHLLQRKITSLSTGETRRSLLARSVLKSPDFLMLDQPFVGLDSESRTDLRSILEELQDIAIVIVCSEKDVPDFINSRIYLNQGRIVDSKPMDEKGFDKSLIARKMDRKAHLEFDVAVEFKSASVNYGEFYALRNFSWLIKKGERWALMGPNGSGKSTIISLITADNPQAYKNDITLFDRRRGTGESIWDIKKKIGFVSPELQLYCENDISVWKIVASGLFDTAGLYKELKDSELRLVFDYIKMLGLADVAERKFQDLSTGEQRLCFLARALVKNPPLLILDEPCQGLDYSQMVRFRELVDFIVREFDLTLIYVTHYEEELPSCIEKRLDISEGQVIRSFGMSESEF